ncbi:MAG: hypothetical protein L0K41_05710 [Yaniella sp.]|uniref:hypothetical protein n=1 Tax=Yaniella sp. TaxID=2773929 RepID=UPI002647607D|nr:hypothetical protein [Yaniella sp.]MDN5731928.1 hypothetical protein [Yaniella sp.]MDN5815223.1 hypothetical protein [Yaniella sp.]MDN5818520.1 hypothetical protein [Yaniella sp.]MDN5838356.1 hypothetical protein [Yaniella sp.]MDN5888942.1 hypothetical protein [Yaniella sp.]
MSQYPQYQQQQLPPSNLPYAAPPQHTEGLGSWVLAIFLTMIPLVNIIYLLVLAFGGSVSVAKKNFARATLIWTAVGIVFSIVVAILFASFGVSILNELSETYSTNYEYNY